MCPVDDSPPGDTLKFHEESLGPDASGKYNTAQPALITTNCATGKMAACVKVK